MLVDIEKIKVRERIRKDFGNIEELAQDIKENSLLNAITVVPLINGEYQLVAGERRLRACKSLGMTSIVVNAIAVRDAEQILRIEIAENENRKEFSFSERMEWAKRLEEIEKIKARERQEMGVRLNSDEGGRTDESVAEASGFGGKDTYRKAKFVAENADEETIKQLDEKQISVHAAYQKLKNEANEAIRKVQDLVFENKQNEKKYKEFIPKDQIPLIESAAVERLQESHQVELDKKEELLQKQHKEKIGEMKWQLDNVTEQRNKLEKKLREHEHSIEEIERIQKQIKDLNTEKADLNRQIDSAVSLARLSVQIEEMLKNQLAPIKYSRALMERRDSKAAMKNLLEIINTVEDWCLDMRKYLPNKNYIEAEMTEE